MNPNNQDGANEKNELIEQALQESVSGGTIRIRLCDLHCSIFSVNVCDFTCGVKITF
jgi:hypothetical protein